MSKKPEVRSPAVDTAVVDAENEGMVTGVTVSNAVAIAAAIPQENLPAINDADELEALAGFGMENVKARDLLIPRIAIIQRPSPQLKRGKPGYLEGAEFGDICDVSMSELLPRPFRFLPVYYFMTWNEWKPRGSGGQSLANIHTTDELMEKTHRNDQNIPILPNGNSLIQTMQFYGIALDIGNRRVFLPMASTQIQSGRKLLSYAQGERLKTSSGKEIIPPFFYRSYFLDTSARENTSGDWCVWTVERGPAINELPDWKNLMQNAKEFYTQLFEGRAVGDNSSGMSDDNVIDSTAERPM